MGQDGAGHACVRIADTGTGIAPEDQERLFDRFYRASNTRGRSVEGSGIGLSLVRSLVELQHGTIDLRSALGDGTEITIRLPAADSAPVEHPNPDPDNLHAAEAASWTGEEMSATRPGRGRQRVLIADDNADMRKHLDRVLSAHWDTTVVGDGVEALRAIREDRPDVVVTDVMMPGLDGFGFAAAVRADPRLSSLPLLMLSARAGVEAVGEGLASGADDYLPKPFSSQELVDRVAARLAAASRDRALRVGQDERAALARLTAELGAARSESEVLAAVLAAPDACARAAAAAIGIREPAEPSVRVTYGGALPAEVRDRYHVLEITAPVPICHVIETGEPMVITDTRDLDPRYRQVVSDVGGAVRSCVIYPVRDDAGTVIGAVALLWPEPQAFTPAELDGLRSTSDTVGTAVRRVRAVEHEHRIATDFQDQLLDLDRGTTAAAVSAVYRSAGEAMRVGGDWYVVAPHDDPECVGISVGDVVGHGLPAATVMSKLRSAITATALTTPDPAELLRIAERYAAAVPGAACATVAYATIDNASRTLDYACAGHPYPLLVTPEGVEYLQDGRRPPLAARSCVATGRTGHHVLPPDSLVVLYTDGLIERPGESLDAGFDRLAHAAADCAHLPVHAVCSALLDRMAPSDRYRDDVVVLALRPTGAGADSFVSALPASFDHLAVLRADFGSWLADRDVSAQGRFDIQTACGEALSNAIEHGSGLDPKRTVTVEAFARPDTIDVVVSDSGRWTTDSSRSRRTSHRGRGLTLINGLCHDVRTERTSRGTHVTMTHRRTPGADQ